MAASTTDAYNNVANTSANGGDSNLVLLNNTNCGSGVSGPVVSVTTGHNNSFWPGDSSSTSPSSDYNWEIDEEEAIKRKIYELKRQFHNGRFLIVRHLPRDSTEEDVRSLLNGNLVHSIQIQPSSATARVLLAEPEVLETWAKTSQHNLKGQKVTISLSNTEGLLCLARLPQDYSEEDFCALVASLGESNYCFLMRSEKTGESKGYGFIEYINKEVAMQAKAALDGRELRDTTLVCDWLDPSHVTFASLQSTCLYVDCLPKDYRDMGEFRRIFSKITHPPYCQIAMKQGAIQDWGLVEYISADDAEETRNLLNGHTIKSHPIRVSYYVPGVRAINIYMKLISDSGLKKRGALLPEPPTNKVFNQLRNLTKHNPAFAKSLQNIILTQIQSLQQRGVAPPTSIGGGPPTPVSNVGRVMGPPPPTISLPLHLPQHFIPQHIHPPRVTHLSLSPPPGSPDQPLNSNAQAALVILLAAQIQQQQEQHLAAQQQQNGTVLGNGSNLLSNPQVLSLLQSLVTRGDPNTLQKSQPAIAIAPPLNPPRNGYTPVSSSNNSINPSPISTANILSSNLKNNFRNGYFKNGTSKFSKGPLLPTPATSSTNGFSNEEPHPELENGVAPILNDLLGGPVENPKDELNSSIVNLLSNPQTLHQLLGSLTPDSAPSIIVPATTMSPHSALIASPPMLHSPNTDPLMTFLPPPDYLSHIEAPPPPFLLAPPRVNPPLLGTVFTQGGAALPPRLINPLYLTRNMVSHPSHMLPFQFEVGGFSTPVGQKRKSSHFLPSPEASPENGYIGQHSQGIGGHYTDSYKKKKH